MEEIKKLQEQDRQTLVRKTRLQVRAPAVGCVGDRVGYGVHLTHAMAPTGGGGCSTGVSQRAGRTPRSEATGLRRGGGQWILCDATDVLACVSLTVPVPCVERQQSEVQSKFLRQRITELTAEVC